MSTSFLDPSAPVARLQTGDRRYRRGGSDSRLAKLVVAGVLLMGGPPSQLAAQVVTIDIELLFTIGELDGEIMFGDVAGIAVDPATGTIVATDYQTLRMYAFAPDGSMLDAVGTRGGGPGEFGSPGRPVVSRGALLYPDAGNQWIARWALDDGSLEHVGQQRFELMSNRHCGSDNHLYIQWYRDGGLIERVNPETFEGVRFGRPLYEAEGINLSMITGRMACTPDDAVYLASGMSVLRKYDGRSGTLLWERDIPGVIAPEVEAVGPTRLPQYRRPEGQESARIVSVVPLPDGPLLVQTSQERLEPLATSTTGLVDVETLVFEADSGELIEQRDDLPRIDYAAGGRAYAWPSTPFPQIRVYRLEAERPE